MRTTLMAGLMAVTAITPVILSGPAAAQDYGDRNGGYHDGQGRDGRGRGGPDGPGGYGNRGGQRGDYRWNGDRNGGWDPSQHYNQNGYAAGRGYQERRLGRNDRIYRGGDGRYYCRRNDGTTGLVIGAIGGGLLGGAIGGNTLGALLGAGGGALLGRSVDRGNVRCR